MTDVDAPVTAGVTLLYANARPGGSLDSLSKDLLGQARQLAASAAPPAELQRVKKVQPLEQPSAALAAARRRPLDAACWSACLKMVTLRGESRNKPAARTLQHRCQRTFKRYSLSGDGSHRLCGPGVPGEPAGGAGVQQQHGQHARHLLRSHRRLVRDLFSSAATRWRLTCVWIDARGRDSAC